MVTRAFEPLLGTYLRRLDGPAPDVLAFSLVGKDVHLVLLVRLRGAPLGLGLVDQRPRGADATGAITRFRHHLAGAQLKGIERLGDSGARLLLRRGERSFLFDLLWSARTGNCLLRDASTGEVITQLHQQASATKTEVPTPWTADEKKLFEAGSRLLASLSESAADPVLQTLSQAIQRRIRGLRRRAVAISEDAARVSQAGQLRADANLLLAHLHALRRTPEGVEFMDGTVDPPELRRFPLPPGTSPQQHATQWFVRARKLERGAQIAEGRAVLTQHELERLLDLQQRIERGVDGEGLAAVVEEARRLGTQGLASSAKSGVVSRQRLPYHEFRSGDGHLILVGRGARDNDELTLHYARPQDLFLHVRGSQGSHVIVQLARGETCPADALLDAATLAAHFSAVRSDGSTEVSYAGKRHVRKRKGAAAGSVVLGDERVLHLRIESDRLHRLLATKLAK